jgi:glycosyltransferase involved in cell wall biosynthesis
MTISVICPFYNEAEIIEHALREMLGQLSSLGEEWELIVVNDGSTDGSEEIARRVALDSSRLQVLGYPYNRGRGFALRTGIDAARGDIIVTTEIDLSWGDNIVQELVAAMNGWPDVDIVVASPHLAGGCYKNVPFKRVWLSRIGNRVIRSCMLNAVTMNTGMTRAYRRKAIKSLPLFEDGKEFHLEVILKAIAFGFRIREIPAVLEWKEYKHHGRRVKRKSSSQVNRLIVSHSLFSVFANPVRYVWAMSFFFLVLGAIFLIGAVWLFYRHEVSAYTALLSISLVILGIVLFVMGVVVKQGNMIQREIWMLQSHRLEEQGNKGSSPAEVPAKSESEAAFAAPRRAGLR